MLIVIAEELVVILTMISLTTIFNRAHNGYGNFGEMTEHDVEQFRKIARNRNNTGKLPQATFSLTLLHTNNDKYSVKTNYILWCANSNVYRLECFFVVGGLAWLNIINTSGSTYKYYFG